MRDLSFYEFAGVVAPGVLLLVGLVQLVPALQVYRSLSDVQLGGLGIFAVLAYAVGHLLQAVGNLLENAYWGIRGGMPTQWVRKGGLVSPEQHQRIANNLSPPQTVETLAAMDSKHWFAVTREVYAAVSQGKRAERVEVFNGNYGLTRGLAAAAFVLLVIAAILDYTRWERLAMLAGLVTVALYRMNRFGVHYARELFVQFLDLRSGKSTQP